MEISKGEQTKAVETPTVATVYRQARGILDLYGVRPNKWRNEGDDRNKDFRVEFSSASGVPSRLRLTNYMDPKNESIACRYEEQGKATVAILDPRKLPEVALYIKKDGIWEIECQEMKQTLKSKQQLKPKVKDPHVALGEIAVLLGRAEDAMNSADKMEPSDPLQVKISPRRGLAIAKISSVIQMIGEIIPH
jgi:hypothetical protein